MRFTRIPGDQKNTRDQKHQIQQNIHKYNPQTSTKQWTTIDSTQAKYRSNQPNNLTIYCLIRRMYIYLNYCPSSIFVCAQPWKSNLTIGTSILEFVMV
ncbi:uncharacterized protein LOC135427347 [Drosophila montana]|uniref:uncharacterized protein LOC135427347 n=1 Tax=Drosophila montana TaxID=40370 RepID=UPI00313AB3FE